MIGLSKIERYLNVMSLLMELTLYEPAPGDAGQRSRHLGSTQYAIKFAELSATVRIDGALGNIEQYRKVTEEMTSAAAMKAQDMAKTKHLVTKQMDTNSDEGELDFTFESAEHAAFDDADD
jgi:L-ascorbate metabolism protein UlaG (beta-lactamase superfamily)